MPRTFKFASMLALCAFASMDVAKAQSDYIVSKAAILQNCKQRKTNEGAESRCHQAIMGISMMSNFMQDKELKLCLAPEYMEKAADTLVAMIEANPNKGGDIGAEEKKAIGSIMMCKP